MAKPVTEPSEQRLLSWWWINDTCRGELQQGQRAGDPGCWTMVLTNFWPQQCIAIKCWYFCTIFTFTWWWPKHSV